MKLIVGLCEDSDVKQTDIPDMQRIHQLWDELADFSVTEARAAREHLFAGVCQLIDACNATWIGAVRMGEPHPQDPIKGWRPRMVLQWQPTPVIEQMARKEVVAAELGEVDASTVRNVALAGQYRVNRLCDLVSADWFESDFYRHVYLDMGHCDAIWAGIPVNEDVEVYYGFHRANLKPMFTEAERDIVSAALRGLKWFHQRQLLAEGIGVASAPLSAAERQVLHGLLTGQTHKQIATTLGHSQHTTREYARRIFRKYGVSDGTQLMALWLGG